MSKRWNNKRLFFILAGLLVILLLTVILKIPKEKSTLKDSLVEFDTAAVAKIVIVPRAESGKPFEFLRENDRWIVSQDDIKSTPMKGAVGNIFSEILGISPQSLAAVGESKWNEFELTDSLATRIRFLNKKEKELAEVMIGKFTYRQVNNPYGGYGGNNIEGTTYVRLPEEEEIYSVDGFLAFSFSGGFNDWRDKSFLRCNKDDITKVTFTFPADSSFTLTRRDSLWFAGAQPTDSATTANYLNSVSLIDGQEFSDGFRPVLPPEYQLVIEGNNLLNITVKCYKGEGDDYILNSSLNPQIYFATRRNELFEKLFKPLSYFIQITS